MSMRSAFIAVNILAIALLVVAVWLAFLIDRGRLSGPLRLLAITVIWLALGLLVFAVVVDQERWP
jgi:hypothetical protein